MDEVVVVGELEMWREVSAGSSGRVNLPSCECCGSPKYWYWAHLPEEWDGKQVEVRVRLLKED